jgi:sarcosine oxidase subunit alpha
MEEFGPWMRPAAYPLQGESLEQAAIREATTVRTRVGLFDGSPLGKLEIHGPDAATFLDWMYVGTMSTLKVGSARYGALLSETGILVDDGIVARLADDHFWVNTSSGAADRTPVAFENWLQCEFLDMRVSVTPVTSQWGNVTVAGPRAWDLMALCGFPAELAPQVMPHMAMREVVWKGIPVRVLRASFSGEQGYELNIPSGQSEELFDALWRQGQPLGVIPYGVEALQIMRIEKGYIHIGTDSDGASFPDDLGLAGPIAKKQRDFVGRRSLERPVALDPNRQQLVGLVPVDKSRPIPVGAHIVQAAPPSESHGFVTSSCHSVVLGHSIALARLTRGRSRIGERVTLFNLGQTMEVEVTNLPFVDPKGERLHAQ